MPSNFPGAADSFDDATTIHGKKQDGTTNSSPPSATYHSDLLGGLGDAIEAVEGWLLGGQISFEAQPGQTANLLVLKDENSNDALAVLSRPTRAEVDLFSPANSNTNVRFVCYGDENFLESTLQVGADDAYGCSIDAYVDLVTPANSYTQVILQAMVGQTAPLLDLKDENGDDLFTVTLGADHALATVKHGTTRVELLATDLEGFPEASLSGFADNQNYWYLDAYQDVGTPANSYTRLYLKAQTVQTTPLLMLQDESSNNIFTVSQELDAVWTVDGIAGAPIVADAGEYALYWSGGNVTITYGDSQATIQASFDSEAGSGTVTVDGNWDDLTLTLHAPLGLAIGASLSVLSALELLGDPVSATLTKTFSGRTNAATLTGQFTVTANTGLIGEPAVSITKYDGTPSVSHLDDDGGFVFGTITGSESGTLVADYVGAGAGDVMLAARLASYGMFQVVSPGTGFATTINAHEATDVPLTISGWNGQTANFLQVLDGDTSEEIFTVGPSGSGNVVDLSRGDANIQFQVLDVVGEETLGFYQQQVVVNGGDIEILVAVNRDDPTGSQTRLWLKAQEGQTGVLLVLKDEGGDDIFTVGPDGTVTNKDVLKTATAHLTAAEISTLFSNPTEIVPAPGAGKVIWFTEGIVEWVPGVTGYRLGGGLFYGLGDFALTGLSVGDTIGSLLDPSIAPVNRLRMSVPTADNIIRADAANGALALAGGASNPTVIGAIVITEVNAGGTGYAPGDTGTIDSPAYGSAATYQVTTVGGGAVTAFTVTAAGIGYEVSHSPYSTSAAGAQPGVGTGFAVDVLSVPPADGDIYVTVKYQIIDLH